jgi:nucleoside-diphosphate-sugar epimerase
VKRILITGASGFIGQQVVLALRGSGYEIHTIHNSARQMSDSRNHTLDLMDRPQVSRLMEKLQPTHLMHLAWYAEHGKFWTSPLNLDWVSASLHLFQSFVNNGGQRAVFAGSCAEYDWSHSPLNEESSPSNPGTLYGVCKNSLRQVLEKFAAQSNVSVAWGRIFFLYGHGEHPNRLIPSILQPLLNDKPAAVRSGAHIRNLMHVEDVAGAFAAILNSSVKGIVNVAGDEAMTLGDVARLIGELTGKSHLLQIEQAEGTRDNPIMLTADTAKLHSIGFTPKYTLRDGLATLIDPREPK